jgi:hypothetical protein
MNDATLLYIGAFCFGMTVLGMILTYYEFRKMTGTGDTALHTGGATQSEAVRKASLARVR